MAIRGSLSEASLPDVLQLLAMGNKTGTLSLSVPGSGGTICFEAGRICHASVTGRSTNTEESVFLMFNWDDGSFSFEQGVRPPGGSMLVSVDPQELLLEGARRVDEWSLIEKKLPSFAAVFTLDRQQMLRNKIAFTEEQQRLLPLIDGHRDVNELMRVAKMGEFDTGKALFGLLSGGFLIPVGPRGASAIAPDSTINEHRNLGIAFYRAGMHLDAAREFRRITEVRPNDAAASFYIGLIALHESRWNDAVTAFQRSAVTSPRTSSVLINMGYGYERLGQLEKARLAYEQVIARAQRPEPAAHLGLAAVAIQRGDIDAAQDALDAARYAWGPGVPPSAWYHYAGLASLMRGDALQAVTVLGEGVQRYPTSAVLLANLSAAHEACGNAAEAAEANRRSKVSAGTAPR